MDQKSIGPEAGTDAFILFNESEDLVASIERELSAQGVRTYFWRRDIAPGEPWSEVEAERLASARTVIVFLGDQGWGPNHRRIAEEAVAMGKRIIPVLIGVPPDGELAAAGGIFETLRYISLDRETWRANLPLLMDALRGEGPLRRFDYIVNILIDGSDEQRFEIIKQVVRQVRNDAFPYKLVLADRLRTEIKDHFSPHREHKLGSAERDPKRMPAVRSWMISVLILLDAEDAATRELVLQHLNLAYETDRSVRFWTLAGLYESQVSYLSAAVGLSANDPASEIDLLAQAIARPEDSELIAQFRSRLQSGNFEEAWPVLRVLRVLSIRSLVADVCKLVDEAPGGRPWAYDAFYVLCNPEIAADAARELSLSPGVDRVVEILIGVVRKSDQAATRRFAALLAAFERHQIEGLLAAALERDPEASGAIRAMRRAIRDWTPGQGAPELYVAGFNSDVIDVAQDDLDIREDVQTLTAVMLAKEVIPPLAIGLFGDWGTGKSFFMRSMKAATTQIIKDAIAKGGSKYCTKVVSIEFNAWNYADTNLWASLVTHILESLASYVSPGQTVEEQRAQLVQQLSSARAAAAQAKDQLKNTEAQVHGRQAELQSLQLVRQRKELELSDLRFSDLQALLAEDPALKKQIKGALEDLGVPSALSSLSEMERAAAEVNSLGGRIAALFVGLMKGQDRKLVLLLVAVVLFTPLAGAWVYQSFQSSFVVIGTVVAEVAVGIAGAAALLRKAAGYVKTHIDKLEVAKRKVEARLAERRLTPGVKESELEAEIVALKAEEGQVASRLQAAMAKVVDLEQRITTLAESQSLSRFLAERTTSDDYRKHLGLISTIRADFDALTARLVQAPTRGDTPVVERIILYIDDLDRCPSRKVVDVLEAVHLLLAYPLFVVVVGVDPRWLSSSLKETYAVMGTDQAGGSANWQTTPQNYLEKIFQIPVRLRPMTEEGYGNLVKSLFRIEDDPGRQPTSSRGSRPPPAAAADPKPDPDAVLPTPAPSRQEEENLAPPPGLPTTDKIVVLPIRDAVTIHDEALVITSVEATFAERLFDLLPTPRATKRFANIYRILKAPVLPEDLSTFEGLEQSPGTFQVPMLLLAMLIGRPEEAAALFPTFHDRIKKGFDPVGELLPSDGHSYGSRALRDRVESMIRESSFPRSAEVFLHWLPKVSRFSFEIAHPPQATDLARAKSAR